MQISFPIPKEETILIGTETKPSVSSHHLARQEWNMERQRREPRWHPSAELPASPQEPPSAMQASGGKASTWGGWKEGQKTHCKA